MIPRTELFQLLSTDSVLLAEPFNLNENRVWPNFALDKSPRSGYFIVLRWGDFTKAYAKTGTTALTIWAYVARQTTTDFAMISDLLERVEDLVLNNFVATFTGRSGDLVDEGYDALAKHSNFEVGNGN